MSNWGQYFCNVNDKFSSILVDLDLKDQLPDHLRTDLIWIWVYMNAPRPDGLSSNEEFEILNSIEDALTERLEKDCDASLAGRITGDGRREFYYYGRTPSNLRLLVEQELGSFPGYCSDFDTQPDPDWRQYLDVLYPTEENYQRIKNMAVLGALGEAGDDPEIVRPVWHYVFFDSDDGRKRFIGWSKDNGFQESERVRTDGPGKLEPGMVCVVRSHSVRPDEIDNYVLEVFGAAKQFGGEYDGWETRVEKR
jgi:regulator of RNase E activity RraB